MIYSSLLRYATLFLVMLSFVSAPESVFAQGKVGITVSPPVLEDRVEPGALVSYSLKVENQGDITETLYPRVYDVTGITREGQPQFAPSDPNSPHALSSWITFSDNEVVLPPRGVLTYSFTVQVPEDATPGAHIGSVALTRDAPSVAMGTGVGYEVRSIVSLRVAGEVVERAKVKEFYADQVFFSTPNVVFTTTVDNEGNVFARPKGFIDIKNMFGKKVVTLPVNDGAASVFPLSERAYTTEWASDDFQMGKYTAEMTLTVEGALGFQSLLGTVEFWIIPTHIVLPALGGLLFVLVCFWLMLRMYVAKQVRRATGGRGSVRAKDAASLSRLSVVVIGLLISVIVGLMLLLFVLGEYYSGFSRTAHRAILQICFISENNCVASYS